MTKLELTWPGKNERPRLEPRILLDDPALSHHAAEHRPGSLFDNLLIKGDNLLALKALEAAGYGGKVKCIFIDPPYNTGSAFEHYDDGLEHSLWLSMMRDRLAIFRNLLAETGSLWITVDDNEAHYLKVIGDEVFGRSNFIADIAWQKRTSPESRVRLGAAHDHILVFAKDSVSVDLNKLPLSETDAAAYKNPDNDPRGPWASSDFTAQGWRPNQMYSITTPSGVSYQPPDGRCWGAIESVFESFRLDNRIWFGKDGSSRPRVKTFLSEVEGRSAWTWWPNSEAGHNQEAKKEQIALHGAGNAFATPKPERLLLRILSLATNQGDLVLDSFAGSGTTGAVAHKMGRRWIMVEIGDHAETHIVPRLKKVIDGTDKGGVTEAVGWKGGGGFRFARLAPSLLRRDGHGLLVIDEAYNPEMLAQAMCAHFNFRYAPNADVWWQHGQSSERDYLYVTTQSLTADALRLLSEEVGPDRSLLVACKAHEPVDLDNVTCVKIPNAVLDRCEWGRDDYSLRIASLPQAEPTDLFDSLEDQP